MVFSILLTWLFDGHSRCLAIVLLGWLKNCAGFWGDFGCGFKMVCYICSGEDNLVFVVKVIYISYLGCIGEIHLDESGSFSASIIF